MRQSKKARLPLPTRQSDEAANAGKHDQIECSRALSPLSPQGRGWLRRRRSRERGMSLGQAKLLRSRMSDAERRLWYRLRAHRFDGAKFKRQVPVGKYVVDFACLNRKL